MKTFFKRAIFWNRVRDTLAILGTPGGAIAAYVNTNPLLLTISVVCAVLVAAIAIWMVDSDKNGIVDIFQDDTEK